MVTPLDTLLGTRSMRDVERQCGLSRRSLGRWRAGTVVPRRVSLARLAAVLDVPLETVADAVVATVAMARRREERAP